MTISSTVSRFGCRSCRQFVTLARTHSGPKVDGGQGTEDISGPRTLFFIYGCLAGTVALCRPRSALTDLEEKPVLHDPCIEDFYQIPEPAVRSGAGRRELWEQFGVNVKATLSGDRLLREFAPRTAAHRPLGVEDEARLRDARGVPVGADRNPGVRVESNFISDEEEVRLAKEIQQVVEQHGALMGNAREYAGASGPQIRMVLMRDGRIRQDPEGTPGPMWRVTGRPEDGTVQRLPPWGYGKDLDKSRLPPLLAEIVDRLERCGAFSLGPLRDVTINLRNSGVSRLDPHIDPLSDGANCFVLTLLSGTVLTFSPIEAMRRESARACDPSVFGMRSFTDDDVDCIARRRSLIHFSGDARYRWTHAIRPGFVAEIPTSSGEASARILEWWGTREQLLERKDDRISIVFAFADPFCDE